jgi:uncharacterized protein
VRLVLDTNVLIAAFVARGVCHELFEYCEREHTVVTSEFILDEFEQKLREKFKVPPAAARAARMLNEAYMEVVTPEPLPEPVCRDPDDDWVLATARSGACECIVTEDKDLLAVARLEQISVVSPADFWRHAAMRHPQP